MIRLKELHFKMQDKEYLSSSEKNLDEHFEKELNPCEPSCRASMKNSVKQKDDQTKGKRS